MNVSKILLKIVSFINGLLPGKPRQYRVALQKTARVTSSKIVQNISDHTGLSKTYVKAVIDALPESINDYTSLGNTVELEDFLLIKPYIKVKAVSSADKANATTIVRRSFKTRAIGAFAELCKSWRFETLADAAEEGDANDENSGLTDEQDEDENQNQQGGQQTGGGNTQTGGNQQQTPTTYTLTLKKHDGTTMQTLSLAAGAAITYPANTSGYQWPASKPATMPAQNTTVQEVVIPQAGSNATLRWVKENMTVAKEMQVAVGSTIAQSDIPANTDRDHYWGKSLTQINEWLAAATAGQTLEIDEYDERF